MKKLLITLSFLLLAFSAIAQEHLTFKSIPIDGSLSQFSAKLKADGFKEVATDNDGTWFIGKFTGKDCRILVQSSSVSKTVYAVYALFDNRSEWSMAKSDYNALKEALARKYGQPKSTEEFDKYYKEDGYEFMHMGGGHIVWQSDFDTKLGTIFLYIKEQSVNTGCAIIQYRDKINSEKATIELSDDL